MLWELSKKQPRCSQLWGSARDLPYRLLGFHVLGCCTCLGPAVSMCQTWKTDGLDRGPSKPHHLEQVISQPLASSTNSPLCHFVPVSLRTRLLSTSTSLPVCVSVFLPFVQPTCLCQLSVWPRTVACPLPHPLHPSEDTREQSLRNRQPRISSCDHTAPSVAPASSGRNITT